MDVCDQHDVIVAQGHCYHESLSKLEERVNEQGREIAENTQSIRLLAQEMHLSNKNQEAMLEVLKPNIEWMQASITKNQEADNAANGKALERALSLAGKLAVLCVGGYFGLKLLGL
jgi:peptidoglycan hydrolase CwlO-like protein